MIIVSYDISNTKLRTRFSKMLLKNGGIQLQFSVLTRSEERRVGKECRSRWSPYH